MLAYTDAYTPTDMMFSNHDATTAQEAPPSSQKEESEYSVNSDLEELLVLCRTEVLNGRRARAGSIEQSAGYNLLMNGIGERLGRELFIERTTNDSCPATPEDVKLFVEQWEHEESTGARSYDPAQDFAEQLIFKIAEYSRVEPTTVSAAFIHAFFSDASPEQSLSPLLHDAIDPSFFTRLRNADGASDMRDVVEQFQMYADAESLQIFWRAIR